MGSCLSKKTTTCSNSTTAVPDPPDQKPKTNLQPQLTQTQIQIQSGEKKKTEEEKPKSDLKKEIFLIKHRISHDQKSSDEEKPKSANTQNTTTPDSSEAADVCTSNLMSGGGVGVRTSSCSKEEIDAILIQCGRLSRSSSACDVGGGRKYSGSKRSYDFDHDNKGNGNDGDDEIVKCGGGDEAAEAERGRRHRQRHRQSSTPTSSGSRRRTPSRERDQNNQRSGSRERGGGGGGGRRVSRSPGRRSESPITSNTNSNNNNTTSTARPGKMVSVPATVSSMAMDKSGNGEPPNSAAAGITRIAVRRNVGSPRARSPAGARVTNEKQQQNNSPRARSPAGARVTNQQQPLSLSRSNSRKAEQSPYRRNPLGEIDQNCVGGVEVGFNKGSDHIVSQAPIQKANTDNVRSNRNIVQGAENKTNTIRAKEQLHNKMEDEGKLLTQPNIGNVTVTMVPSVTENQKLQQVTRTRSSRLSRDLDFNPETLLNPSPTSSYTALLLEDIQNFHQKSSPVMSLPACLTKACSILDAVADLNCTTISNLSTAEQFGKKKKLETKEPFVESEVIGSDDLMEPSFHKYVTVSRGGGGGGGGGEMEEVESSGSNSFIGGGQNWVSSSLWETNSVDSTDKWSSLRSEQKRESDQWSSLRSEQKREESDRKPNGIGRGRLGSGIRGLQSSAPTLKAASS